MLPATACTSSTMTVSTPRSVSRAWEVSSRNSDSGVVIRMSGGLLTSFLRSSLAVSPVRTATVMSGSASPSRCAACRIPVSGARRFRSMSTASAFSGETYSTRVRRFGSSGGGAAASLSIAHRNAASVLPDPVGATTSVSLPWPMARHAPAWAFVGSANAPTNQARVAGENPSSTSPVPVSGESSDMLPYCPDPPTFSAAVQIRPAPVPFLSWTERAVPRAHDHLNAAAGPGRLASVFARGRGCRNELSNSTARSLAWQSCSNAGGDSWYFDLSRHAEKAEAVHGDLRVPLSAIRGVEVLDDAWDEWIVGCADPEAVAAGLPPAS